MAAHDSSDVDRTAPVPPTSRFLGLERLFDYAGSVSEMQGSLFGSGELEVRTDAPIQRTWLDAECWVDMAHGWLGADDRLDAERRRRSGAVGRHRSDSNLRHVRADDRQFRHCERDRYARSDTRRDRHLGDYGGWIRRCGRHSRRGDFGARRNRYLCHDNTKSN